MGPTTWDQTWDQHHGIKHLGIKHTGETHQRAHVQRTGGRGGLRDWACLRVARRENGVRCLPWSVGFNHVRCDSEPANGQEPTEDDPDTPGSLTSLCTDRRWQNRVGKEYKKPAFAPWHDQNQISIPVRQHHNQRIQTHSFHQQTTSGSSLPPFRTTPAKWPGTLAPLTDAAIRRNMKAPYTALAVCLPQPSLRFAIKD